jgi:UDP-glucose 4-epimerase
MAKKFIFAFILILKFCPSTAWCITPIPESIINFYKNLPVLVTGGAGFVGSHLVEALVQSGAQVTVLDDLSSGTKDNLSHISEQILFVHGTITDFETCMHVTQGKQVIFHLAAQVSVPESLTDPHRCHRINDYGTLCLLESARRNSVPRFIFSSSCAVYGTSDGVCVEEDTPHPQSPYGYSKLRGEQYCTEYHALFGLHTVALRYFNIFGPRQNPSGPYAAVVAKFIDALRQNKPITIFGDGTQTRDFVPVSEIVYANLIGAFLADFIAGNCFNIATGRSTSLTQILSTLRRFFPQYTGEVIFVPARPGDVKYSAANIEKYKALKRKVEPVK